MDILISVTTVLFMILCLLLVIVILLQSDKSAGMGILGGASSQSTFGSSTADVITKITAVMIALFMVGSLSLSIMESRKISAFSDKLLGPEEILKDEPVSPPDPLERMYLEGE